LVTGTQGSREKRTIHQGGVTAPIEAFSESFEKVGGHSKRGIKGLQPKGGRRGKILAMLSETQGRKLLTEKKKRCPSPKKKAVQRTKKKRKKGVYRRGGKKTTKNAAGKGKKKNQDMPRKNPESRN